MNKILIQNIYLELGLIVPKATQFNKRSFFLFHVDVKQELNKLDPKEARTAKRKFRKLIRKIHRQNIAKLNKQKTRSGYIENSCKNCPPRSFREFKVKNAILLYDEMLGYGIPAKNAKQSDNRKTIIHNWIKAQALGTIE